MKIDIEFVKSYLEVALEVYEDMIDENILVKQLELLLNLINEREEKSNGTKNENYDNN